MWTSHLLALLALTALVSAKKIPIHRRQSSSNDDDYPIVPQYNFSMPVDHFDANNKQVYNNRYFVNDTYYRPGGPVILHGYGESGIYVQSAADTLAEYNGTKSGVMELARQVHGAVILWEHRYYGLSLPVPMNSSVGTTISGMWEGGLPKEGSNGYAFLNIEQAMQDLVYFANNFNQTQLGDNTVIASTQNMDPYHTPWLYVGGSYSGALAAYVRIRNPEIFYASWSSSGVVESQYDSSSFYNVMYRSIPSNCSSDVKAVIKSFNDVFSSGDDQAITNLKELIYLASGSDDTSTVDDWSLVETSYFLALWWRSGYQSLGLQRFIQYFCDPLERFDGQAYLQNASSSQMNASVLHDAILSNPDTANPSDQGIVAASGNNGIKIGQAAYLYAFTQLFNEIIAYETSESGSGGSSEGDSGLDFVIDQHSWGWQSLTELGFIDSFNATANANMEMVMSDANTTAVHDYTITASFPSYNPSIFPKEPNISEPLKYGGWDMTPSNVMFTNGQADGWRALTVMSEEQKLGAPKRTITQTVPQCNNAPNGADVFGLLYDAAGHAEDMILIPQDQVSGVQDPPYKQGADLFAKAYNAWLPCFNQSRDAVRNGENPNGSAITGDTNGAVSHQQRYTAVWATTALVTFALWSIL